MSAPDPEVKDIKVSVAMVTYNHEPFIAQAIESVVMQQTQFRVELIIGEDCSADGTREIVADYARRYPERIRPLLHEQNVGAQANSIAVLNACRGQYIAALEGDDYWTDPYKLQKQVDFLEAHAGCALCFHNVKVIHEDDSVEPHDLRPPDQRETYTLRDLLQKNFVGTCSVVFRRGLVQELPAWYYDLAMGDWPLHILNAQYGDIGYIDRVMAVRRVHRAGMSQSFTRVQRVKYELEICQHLRSYLGVQYQKSISSATARRYLELAAAQAAHGDIREALSSLQTSITECPVGALKQLVDLAARVARRYERRTRQLLKSVAKPSTGLL